MVIFRSRHLLVKIRLTLLVLVAYDTRIQLYNIMNVEELNFTHKYIQVQESDSVTKFFNKLS